MKVTEVTRPPFDREWTTEINGSTVTFGIGRRFIETLGAKNVVEMLRAIADDLDEASA